MKYRERTYRNKVSDNSLISFNVCVRETDLFIRSDKNLLDAALRSVYKYRGYIESYIKHHPDFLTSLNPITDDKFAPPIVRDMLKTSSMVGVGPMASVAGAIAEYVGIDLLDSSCNVIVENGGDIFLNSESDITIAIFAGDSPLSYKLRLRLKSEQMPMGVCTSSGTVGHSLSFGKADAICVLSKSATMADAAATAVGNLLKNKFDIERALKKGVEIEGVEGIVIIMGESFGAIGEVELI
ncbi:MAG TPA: UPF0280 family protein [Syntrophales bacterium]|nr:UPF0280 family protein [Syntrophales bacterium]